MIDTYINSIFFPNSRFYLQFSGLQLSKQCVIISNKLKRILILKFEKKKKIKIDKYPIYQSFFRYPVN